jgi:hypothetical protein
MDLIPSFFANCFLLLIPILLWNLIFASKLPKAYSAEIFSKDIPRFIEYGENILRLFVFVLPIFMPIHIETQNQKLGFWFYIIGSVIYYMSWLVLIYFPQGNWSLSALGFSAPAYTPLIWLAGIGLIGNKLFFASPYRSWIYIIASTIFVSFHLAHAVTVHTRNLR